MTDTELLVPTDDELAAWTPPHLRPTDGLLTSVQVCDAAGVTFRQLDYWTRRGWIVPAVRATGSGSRRRYDRDTLRDVRLLAAFAGMFGRASLGVAVRVLNLWRDHNRPDDRLVGTAGDIPRLWTDAELLAEIRTGVACVAVAPPPKETP